MQTQDNPQIPPIEQGKGGAKVEIKEVSPPEQEVQASPLAPKRRNIKTLVKRRHKVIRKVIPFPSVLKVILEEEEEDAEDEEDKLLLS